MRVTNLTGLRLLLSLGLLAACTASGTDERRPSTDDDGETGGSSGAGGGAGGGGTAGAASPAAGRGGASAGGGAGGVAQRDAGTSSTGGGVAMADAGGDPAVPIPAEAGTAYVYATGGTSKLMLFDGLEKGELVRRRTFTLDRSAVYLTWHPNRKYLYTTYELTSGAEVVAMAIDGTGNLTELNRSGSEGVNPRHISIHPSGRWLFVAYVGKSLNNYEGDVKVFPVGEDGKVGPMADRQRPATQAKQIVPSPNGRHVFVTCLSGSIAQYSFDATTGKLAPNTPAALEFPGGAGSIAFHPAGRVAYATHSDAGKVSILAVDDRGLLTAGESVALSDAGAGPNDGQVAVHPNGRFLYATSSSDNLIAIFRITDASGQITRVGTENGGGDLNRPIAFRMDGLGKYVVVPNMGNDTMTAFAINTETGALTKVGSTVATGSRNPQFAGVIRLP